LESSEVDRQLKKVVKNDEFKEQVWHGVDFLTHHTADLKKYGAIALAVLLVAGGSYWFIHHQAEVREEALAAALKIDDATVGPNEQAANLHYATQTEKDQATQKAFADVATKYHGTQEGAIAGLNLGQEAADHGDLAGAEKYLKDVVDSAPPAYASLGVLSLAQLYTIEGKTSDAEKILDNLIKNPTITVSKDEAQLALAKVKAKSDPDGARKILESLRTERTAISKAAMSALGELSGQTN
jgi:predicted negative regulator of RcsB-dependent stress response